MKTALWCVCWLSLLVALPALAQDDNRTEQERAADGCIARGMEKLRASAEAPAERKRQLFQEACDLFARAVRHDPNCDDRLFARLGEPETRPEKFLRAELHAMFARGFTAHEMWDKALSNVDAAIALQTARQEHYRQLKATILRRKQEAEGG